MPSPNKYGHVIASGLPMRDAAWLLKLSEQSKSLAVSMEQCAELSRVGIHRFASGVQNNTNTFCRNKSNTQSTWLLLVRAAVTLEQQLPFGFDATRVLFDLLVECEQSFDLRSFQAIRCVELALWSESRLRSIPASVGDWSQSVRDRLTEATRTKPLPPTDQARSADVACDCRYCGQLVAFLADPGQSTATPRARKEIRTHVEDVIRRNDLDVTAKTIRSGTPHGLAMTKTQASY